MCIVKIIRRILYCALSFWTEIGKCTGAQSKTSVFCPWGLFSFLQFKINLPICMYCSLFDKYWGILWSCAIFSIVFSLSWMPQQTLKFLPVYILQNCLFLASLLATYKSILLSCFCLFFFTLNTLPPLPNHLPLLKFSLNSHKHCSFSSFDSNKKHLSSHSSDRSYKCTQIKGSLCVERVSEWHF